MGEQKDMPFGYLFGDVARLYRKNFDRRAERYGLTRAQWRAIRILHYRDGLRQNELAEWLEMDPITVGRVIDRLQVSGFVTREHDPKDRRAWRLHLTERAHAVSEDMEELSMKLKVIATQEVAEDELARAIAVMEKIKSNLLALER